MLERKHVEAIAHAVSASANRECLVDCCCPICCATGNVTSAVLEALAACDESPWRSMESAPKDGAWVFSIYALAPFPRLTIEIVQWIEDGWWSDDGSRVNPTHWMPLPAAPEGV